MTLGLINANPVVHAKKERIARAEDPNADDDAVDPLDVYDILFFFFFGLIRFVFSLDVVYLIRDFECSIWEVLLRSLTPSRQIS